jgi:hypothetical protein
MAQIALAFEIYGKEVKNAIGVWRDPFGVVRTIATAKCSGLKVSLNLLLKMIHTYKSMWWFWVLGLPLLLVPSRVLGKISLENFRGITHFFRRLFRAPAK